MSAIVDMQYHDYVESLLGSRVMLRLVKTLISHPGKVFTVRKLAADADVSSSEAAVLVQELEKYGIIRVQPVGRSYLITLNEQNYILNKILKQIIKAEQDTLNELITILHRYFNHGKIISAAYLEAWLKRESARTAISTCSSSPVISKLRLLSYRRHKTQFHLYSTAVYLR